VVLEHVRRGPGKRGHRSTTQRVLEGLPAHGHREAAGAVVLVVDDQGRGAVRVAERDVHELTVPPRGAERRAGDAHRPWSYELAQVPDGVVLGVGGHGAVIVDREQPGAGVASAVVRATAGVQRDVPVDDGLRPVAGGADGDGAGVPPRCTTPSRTREGCWQRRRGLRPQLVHPPGRPRKPTTPMRSSPAPPRKWVAGTAYHCYSGDPSAQTRILVRSPAARSAGPTASISLTSCATGRSIPG
jgi:hypothetical protein